jgi:hypothetical protein
MSHETREGRKIGDELRHNHFDAAHKEISHEMHAHPKEFENTLKSINKDLAKHHDNPLSVERDSKDQISHINFNNHDIYSSPKAAEAQKTGAADAPKSASGDVQKPAPADAPKPAPGDAQPSTGDTRRPEREGREGREQDSQEGRHHHKHHHKHKHGGKHGHGGRGRGGRGGEGSDSDSDDAQDNDPKKNGKPGDADSNARPGDAKDPASKDASGNPKDPAKAPDGSATAPGADGLRGRDNAEKAMNYFQDKGLTKAQAAGIVGNFDHEAPGVNPSLHQYGGGPGFGIAQWEGPRKREEKKFAKEQGKPADDLKTQLDFAWKEMNTTERGALAAVKRTQTASQAARAFERGFERAGKPHFGAREHNALYAFNRPSADDDGTVLAASR